MTERKFTNWVKWRNRNSLTGIEYPGVYCIVTSKIDLSEQDFEWVSDIAYIGMTNSIFGLKGRLKQFDNTISGKTGHCGADRFLNKYPIYQDLVDLLFVSVCSFPCNVKSNKSEDLRIMGEVAKFEYDSIATYVEKYGVLPEFNDKIRSIKSSSAKKKSN
jgi:hypothetical protein